MYKVFYTKNARRDLKKLDLLTAQRVILKIKRFVETGDPMQFSKILKGIGCRRFRVGDYRVLFDLDAAERVTILNILAIRHRKDVYQKK